MTALSCLCDMAGWRLHRDAQVTSLGFVDIPLEGRLVFALDRRNVTRARAAEGVAAILTSPELAELLGDAPIGVATAADPGRAFLEFHNRLAENGFYGAPAASRIATSARVHPSAHVDPFGVIIGPDCLIEPRSILLAGTELAAGVRVMAAAVLGSEGFQRMTFADGVIDVRHAGRLVVGERTMVMASAVVARAVFRQATLIGADCLIGNGAFVSHNCRIGTRTLVGHQATVTGNCVIGNDVTIGPGAICLERVTVGDGAIVTAGAVVVRPVAPGQRVSGNFAVNHRRALRAMASR